MHVTDQARERPFKCAVLPYIGNSNSSGWIDTGSYLDQEKVYVSFEAAAEMARLIGWVPPSQRRGIEEQNAALQSTLDQVRAERDEAQRELEAIDYLSNHGQLKPYKKAGRPKKETAKTEAG